MSWFFYANDLLWGRIFLQTIATGHLISELKEEEGDTLSDAYDIAWFGFETAMIWNPMLKAELLGAGLRLTAGSGIISTVAAPIAAGTAIGAVAGTAIAGAIWGEEGAQTALGFYSAGTLPGTEAPDLTDYQYIFKPTAPGGPVSLYDVAEAGARGTARGLGWLWSKRPQPRGNPYLML